MSKPIYVRALTAHERQQLQAGLRSADAFVLRRSQMVLQSADHRPSSAIAKAVGCSDQAVRNVIHQFNATGLTVLLPASHRPHQQRVAFTPQATQQLRALVHQSPRQYGQPTSHWTLARLAEISYAQGLTAQLVSDETIRHTLKRLGIGWRRAKRWITSPDPAYARKKTRVTG